MDDLLFSRNTTSTNVSGDLDFKRIAEIVYKRNAELVRLDKMKDEFVSLVSHELRTPLTIIKNYLWLVINEDGALVGPEPMKKLGIVIQSVDRLMLLVEDTLTVSRLENGRISLKKDTFDLVKRVDYIMDIYKIKCDEKKIRTEVVRDVTSLEVNADLNRIHEVVVNILGNAIKFTPDTGGIIIVRVGRGPGENMAFVSITDNGPGIASEKQSKLFTKFGKIDESYLNLHNASGTGLGLYISQEIIKLHGGEITVNSDQGKGATFTITFPLFGDEKKDEI
jgi:signal transduction histidine kinase